MNQKDRLLTDTQIGDRLDLEKEHTYPCSDGSETTTIDCREALEAQDCKTLQKVVEWGEGYCHEHIDTYSPQRHRCGLCWQDLRQKAFGEEKCSG